MLDVGANTGYFSLLAARLVGSEGLVIALEPSQREFQRLLANMQLNHANNVLALNLASGDRLGVSRLTVEPDHTGLNRIEQGEPRAAAASSARLSRSLHSSSAAWHWPRSTRRAMSCSHCGAWSPCCGSRAFSAFWWKSALYFCRNINRLQPTSTT